MNKKVFWISAGVAFVIATLAIGVVAVFTTPWYTVLCGISLIITLFIADGCKKAENNSSEINQDGTTDLVNRPQ